MEFLGSDWLPGPDGLRYRYAARVIVFDRERRLLLAQGHDVDNPNRKWWFTVGGGQQDGESPRQTAVREVREETGLALLEEDLIGPVIKRTAIFDFVAETVRQYEQFFLVFLSHPVELTTQGWTAEEQKMIEALQWWDLDDLAQTKEQVYPESLVAVAKRLQYGWDGVTLEMGDVHDP